MTSDNARQGRRNDAAGKRWRDQAIRWLNEHGWPGAGYQLRNRSSDITGTWDLAVELTDTTWDKMWDKLGQAQRDARERGLTDYCVWKKPYGKTDPGLGEVVMRAHLFFPLVMRLEKLEARALEADDQFARGWTAGVDYERRRTGVGEAV